MKTIEQRFSLNCTITLPGSKSYTNRALIIASLAKGASTLNNPLNSVDTEYMIKALQQLGIRIRKTKNKLTIHGGTLKASKKSIFIGNSGTSARFLTALAALIPGTTQIKGDKNMQKRPIKDLTNALQQLGTSIISKTNFPPVKVLGGILRGRLCKLHGNKSSQYLSALLMIAPYAEKNVIIEIKGELVSKPFIDMTIDIMNHFGVKVINKDYKRFIVEVQRYSPATYTIEPDLTAASYFFAAPAICGGKVKVNLTTDTKQGDIKFTKILKKMGCKVSKTLSSITVERDPFIELKSIRIDMNKMPDVVQTLAIVALFAKGTTKITNVANLKVKETDRIQATATQLRKLGAKVETTFSSISITPPKKLKSAIIETYDDHRMAMSFALVGLKISGIKIKNPSCVNKTFPEFWKTLEALK